MSQKCVLLAKGTQLACAHASSSSSLPFPLQTSASLSHLGLNLQAEAEQKAAAAVKDGLGKQLREAQIRSDTLQDTVQHLQEGMVRQSAHANARWVRHFLSMYCHHLRHCFNLYECHLPLPQMSLCPGLCCETMAAICWTTDTAQDIVPNNVLPKAIWRSRS